MQRELASVGRGNVNYVMAHFLPEITHGRRHLYILSQCRL